MDASNLALNRDDIASAIDQLLVGVYPPDEPGAAVIVVKEGRVICRKAYGMVNLELGIPMRPDNIFRIGSITKQFTAVAILVLAEQGKLALDDEISTFLPDYPTHGHRITVEHLLTHTSGIKSHTNRPDIQEIWRNDVTVPELIAEFKDLPMEFAPGERFSYSNSGYALLGAIIEATSRQTYEEFLFQHIFQPPGMVRTSYDHPERIVTGRAAGYDKGIDGFQNATFVSMSQIYSAGALLSSVDDLAIWDSALSTDRLVSLALLERAWTSHTLNDGASTGYGYGWEIGSYVGHRAIQHGGGIPGFMNHALRLPDDHVFVALLTNCLERQPGPDKLAMKIGALAIDHPYVEPMQITLEAEALETFVGVYRARANEERTVRREGDLIFLQWGDGPRQEILPLGDDEFFVKDDSFTRVRFTRHWNERPMSMEIDGIGPSEVASRADE